MTISSVSWVEVDGSPKIRSNRTSIAGIRQFKVDWSDSETFATELLFGGTGGRPQTFPNFPNLYVDELNVEPFIINPSGGTFTDPETNNSLHDTALVTVNYTPLSDPENPDSATTDPGNQADKVQLDDGTWAEYSMDFSGEFQTLPGRVLVWETDSLQVAPDAHPTIKLPLTTHVVKWTQVPYPPFEHISNMRGCVNDAEWRIPVTSQRLARWTLLFMGAQARRVYKRSGSNGWELTYTFKERCIKALANIKSGGGVRVGFNQNITSVGWNHAFRDGKTPGWDIPVLADGGADKYLYSDVDFKKLFIQQIPY